MCGAKCTCYVFRTKATVKSHNAMSEQCQKDFGFIPHLILDCFGMCSETVYCSQISSNSHIPLHSSFWGQIHSLRSFGPANTLLKWGLWPCVGDWRVTVSNYATRNAKMNFTEDSDRVTLGEQEDRKSVWGLELENGGQQGRNFILWQGQFAKSNHKKWNWPKRLSARSSSWRL